MTAKLSQRQRHELTTLRAAWRAAFKAANHDDSQRAADAEQTAYDSLVDWVDENKLEYTEHDPRGTEAELDALNGTTT